MNPRYRLFGVIILLTVILACSFGGEVTPEPTALPPGDNPTQPGDLETIAVANVVDGDTIELADGRKIRYIGMNTPERDQPYYEEAKEMNRRLVEGQAIRLELDTESLDKYGRTLAYVWIGEVMVNLEIMRQGFANA
jgi:micrococcal nuclease